MEIYPSLSFYECEDRVDIEKYVPANDGLRRRRRRNASLLSPARNNFFFFFLHKVSPAKETIVDR